MTDTGPHVKTITSIDLPAAIKQQVRDAFRLKNDDKDICFYETDKHYLIRTKRRALDAICLRHLTEIKTLKLITIATSGHSLQVVLIK